MGNPFFKSNRTQETMMTPFRKPITALFTAMLLGGSSALFAATSECGPMGPWSGSPGQRAERMQQHRDSLHAALKLSPEQESAWKRFTESGPKPPSRERLSPDEWKRMSAPERADRMLELARGHQEAMATHVEAMKRFYAVLTPEQQKVFDSHHRFQVPARGHRGAPPSKPEAPR